MKSAFVHLLLIALACSVVTADFLAYTIKTSDIDRVQLLRALWAMAVPADTRDGSDSIFFGPETVEQMSYSQAQKIMADLPDQDDPVGFEIKRVLGRSIDVVLTPGACDVERYNQRYGRLAGDIAVQQAAIMTKRKLHTADGRSRWRDRKRQRDDLPRGVYARFSDALDRHTQQMLDKNADTVMLNALHALSEMDLDEPALRLAVGKLYVTSVADAVGTRDDVLDDLTSPSLTSIFSGQREEPRKTWRAAHAAVKASRDAIFKMFARASSLTGHASRMSEENVRSVQQAFEASHPLNKVLSDVDDYFRRKGVNVDEAV